MDNLQNTRQDGKSVIITGSNSGIGYEAAAAMAAVGAAVTLAVRNEERGETAAESIRKAAPGSTVDVLVVDLFNLASVKAAAATFAAAHHHLHMLINNGGICDVPRQLSAEGQEVHMATNHMGHFALTGLLLPLLEAAPGGGGRIVNVSSIGHRSCTDMQWDDWAAGEGIPAYCRSKAANVLFTNELARRLTAAGSSVVAVTAHPGGTRSSLIANSRPSFTRSVALVLEPLLLQTTRQGAQPLVYAATQADVRPAEYWGPWWVVWGTPAKGTSTALTRNEGNATKLWAKSEEVTGVCFLPWKA